MSRENTLTFSTIKTEQGGLDQAFLKWLATCLGLDTFIETGTYRGDTVAAVSDLFTTVHSIELSESLYSQARQRFSGYQHVKLHCGDSGRVLQHLLPQINGPFLLWLDAHYSEGETARGESNTPVMAELEALKQAGCHEAVIMVDDLRLFQAPHGTVNADSSVGGYPTLMELYAKVLEIDAGYQLSVVGDVALMVPADTPVQPSSVVQACTLSRIYDGECLPVDEILQAESVIAAADGEERDVIVSLASRFSASEAYGLCNYFYLWRGLILHSAGQYREACHAFQAAIDQGLNHWRVHWYLAQSAEKSGHIELANRAIRDAELCMPKTADSQIISGSQDNSTPGHAFLDRLTSAGLWSAGQILKLHLGCGEQYLDGYINIDFPPDEHNIMQVRADLVTDFSRLELPDAGIDEIRSHHAFEHFGRVSALGLLIKWQKSLKPGGRLHLETPDVAGSAKILASGAPWSQKMAALRHLAGDQAASWAYHLDLWSGERFEHTLSALGFASIEVKNLVWPDEPHLANVEVVAVKADELSDQALYAAAQQLLSESLVSPAEQPLLEVWMRQLNEALTGHLPGPGRSSGASVSRQPELPDLPEWAETRLSLNELYDANQRQRDAWMAARAAEIPAGSRVLDVGAGTCPYRTLFSHCEYRTHDFKQYEGVKLGGGSEYGDIDYVSDIASIPVADGCFDAVICTEVLEHVAEPIEALREMARVLKQGGRLLITAPLGSGLHQLPYHYYGGYTPEWYRHFGKKFGLDIQVIKPNGGLFRLLAQECARVAWTLPEHAPLHGDKAGFVQHLFGEWLPRFLYGLDGQAMNDQFTIGYHVDAVKAAPSWGALVDDADQASEPIGGEQQTASETSQNTLSRAIRVVSVFFSKDRPMQLHAALNSFYRHAKDAESCSLVVLYTTSSSALDALYDQVMTAFPGVDFVRETNFKQDLIGQIQNATHILFCVDDTVYVRDFSLKQCVVELNANPQSLGVSLRLGENTGYCYPLDSEQKVPALESLGDSLCRYRWTTAEYDFAYPLEVSSSLYRRADIENLLVNEAYGNPNSLEAMLARRSAQFTDVAPDLLCFSPSVAFSVPVNRVQSTCDNRAGVSVGYSAQELAWRFSTGERIDVAALDDFVPDACHQEIEYSFCQDCEKPPTVSIVIPCYRQAAFLEEAVESVVDQTFTDWECIIVDDGSPDETAATASQLIERYSGCSIRLISKSNTGLSSARNTGIEASRGRYILPLDADDRLHPDYLAETVAILESCPELAIVYVDEQNFGISHHVHCKGESSLAALLQANVHDYCSLYRREVWQAVGGYSPAMYLGGEDWNFWVGAAKKGFQSIHLAKPLFLYRNRDHTMVAETLAHLDEVRAHIVLHHPELFDETDRTDAERQLAEMPETSRDKLNQALQKNPACDLLVHFSQIGKNPSVTSKSLSAVLPERPLVSVVVPTYNRPELLKDALLSLLDQRYTEWEAIVVNDEGEDVGELIHTIDSSGRIRYLQQATNCGLSAARNKALEHARGDIVCYLDDDDMYLPDHLSVVVSALQETGAAFVYTDAEYVDEVLESGKRIEKSRRRPHANINYSKNRLHVSNYIPVNTWAHRRELLDETGGFDTSLSALEDWDLLLRISRLTDIVQIHQVTVEVRERKSNTEDNMTARAQKDYPALFREIYARYDVSFNPSLEDRRRRFLQNFDTGAETDAHAQSMTVIGGEVARETVLDEARVSLMAERMVNHWRLQPSIHVLTIVQAGDELRLAETLDALNSQLYKGWGLTVISDMPAPDAVFREMETLEWRQIGEQPLADALNSAITETAADWVAFIDTGDILEPHLLFACADHINRHSGWQMLYVDHDSVDVRGDYIDPQYKPDINPDMLLAMPYLGPFCLFKRVALENAGGFRQAPGVENYDLALRIMETSGREAIGHIAEILYHQIPPNQAQYQQEQVYENGRQAVAEHLARCAVPANVEHGLLAGSYFVEYRHTEQPLVSIVIPTRDRLDLLQPCVDSLFEKTAYPNYEVIIVDNNSFDFDTLAYMDDMASRYANLTLIKYPHEYNYSAINNLAVSRAKGEYIVLLNNDTQIVQANWLDRMMNHGQRPEVGIVGCRLLYPDQRIQHAGVVLGMGAADHIHIGLSLDDPGYMGRAQLVQDFSAVTAACLLVRKSVFDEVGGLDEQAFKVLFNDVDLCLKVGDAGYRIVWTPYATLVHHGSSSIRKKQSDGQQVKNHNEAFHMFEKWLPRLANDPAFNRNLSLKDRNPCPETSIRPGWEPETHDRLRVLGFPFDNWGCGEYRVKAPLRVLHKQLMAQTALVPTPDTERLPEIPELTQLAPDVLLLQSFAHDRQLSALELYRKLFPDLFMVFELDDLKTEMPVKNPHHKTMYRDIRKRLRKALALCDRMVVSTEPLKQAYSNLTSDIVVVPNYLEAERWSGLVSRRRQGHKPRVGWAGAQQHHGDLELLFKVIETTKDEVDWVFFGMCPQEIRSFIKEYHSGVLFDRYPEKLASLNLDLAVAPLEHNRFNEAKSNLRLLEYGAMGWPVIATDIYPYQDAPVTRVHNNTRAWVDAIREHVHDLDAAAEKGDQLQQWVMENWLLEEHVTAWMRALDPDRQTARVGLPMAHTGTG